LAVYDRDARKAVQIMGLFNRTQQRITISSEARDVLQVLASKISARRLKDTKVSSVKNVDGQWQFSINCRLAEAIYYPEIVPLLYDSVKTQSCEVLLEFNDESGLVKKCPRELLVSFRLNSRYAFGDKAEHEFIQKMHRDILKGPQDKPAAAAYYIVGGSSVTMCVPCADTEAMERSFRDKFKAFKIEEFMIKTVDRGSA